MNSTISVIVPIYNVEEYLDECIKSICNQTYKKLEIILVNDGSKDSSLGICKKWALVDNRIRIIDQENAGLSAARNAGMNSATGALIGFVDGDDFIKETMYENLYKVMVKYDADISCCGRYIYRDQVVETRYSGKSEQCLDNNTAMKCILEGHGIDVAAWDKLYKRYIFDMIKYPVGEVNEDAAVICQVIHGARKVAHTGTNEYYYRQRSGSITKSGFSVDKSKLVERHLVEMEQNLRIMFPHLGDSFRKYYAKVNFPLLVNAIKVTELTEAQHKEKIYRLNILRDYFWDFVCNKNISYKNRLIAILIRINFYGVYLRLKFLFNNCLKALRD